jgi:hypothetical protein
MIEVLRDATGLGVADMDMQDGRAGVVAVDRLLHLVVPGDGMSSGQSEVSNLGQAWKRPRERLHRVKYR